MSRPLAGLLLDLCRTIRPPHLRTMLEFAESEIVLPTGPFKGSRFKASRNPYAALLFEAMGSGRWRRAFVTGPSQSGKTLAGFVIPVMYHLFEHGETVIMAAPTLRIATDKWRMDLLPAIKASRYRDLLPRKGEGSQGGEIESVEFQNGAVLRVMTGGGDDQSRANFTSRVLCVTETEGFDRVGESSREADQFAQLEARTNAFGSRARIYAECTVSNESGRTWREYLGGTGSKILAACPHCRAMVCPEREHLTGWRDAETELEAKSRGGLCCPECAAVWCEADRAAAMAGAVVMHRGQRLEGGRVVGEAAQTETLGFRWSAAHNLLVPIGEVARKEWLASRAPDEETAERELSQFFWATPPKTESSRGTLAQMDIISRAGRLSRGEVPADASAVVVSVDVGKWVCHWTATAFSRQADGRVSPHVMDYGRFDVPTADLGEEAAILTALRQFRDTVAAELFGKSDRCVRLGVVDGGYHQDIGLAFAAESPGWCCAKGQGVGQYGRGGKREPGAARVGGGEAWEAWQLPGRAAPLYEHQADHWKGFVHTSLGTPMGSPGCMSLFAAASPGEHMTLARHLLAEKSVEEFVPGKGMVRRWVAVSRQNHFLDALALSCLGASLARVLVPLSAPVAAVAPQPVPSERVSAWLPERPQNWSR